MPPPHLTEPATTATVTEAVLQVLAGAPAARVAAAARLTLTDLASATEMFKSAGQAALEARAEREWYHVTIVFPELAAAERAAATSLAPALQDLNKEGLITGWWFLRKHPGWRLRFRSRAQADSATTRSAVDNTLKGLKAAGIITHWQAGLYEAEIFAFGGPTGITAAHDHFCADSTGTLNYLARSSPGIGRRELSLLLCGTMFNSAGLDRFEIGDVWNTVAQLRPSSERPGADTHHLLAEQLRPLLHADTGPSGPIFASTAPLADAAEWAEAFRRAGRTLNNAATTATLHRGLRHVLAHLVIFHWNRLGLSAGHQAFLATAARDAALPRFPLNRSAVSPENQAAAALLAQHVILGHTHDHNPLETTMGAEPRRQART
jgi:thiopeptide-type bacteriocin biosynthesis protein